MNNLNIDKFKYVSKHGIAQQCVDQTQIYKMAQSEFCLTMDSDAVQTQLWLEEAQ